MPMIPYGRQSITDEDIQAVVKVLKSDWITQGPVTEKFERSVADYCGTKYAVAVSSGTAALHIACLAAGLGKGDTLWTSPNTFVASANCALYCGAKPDFVDIDPHTYNVAIAALEGKLAEAEKNGCLPKIVIPVHFAGQSCDMEQLSQLSKQYEFTVIEDACHAIGGNYKDCKIGSCKFSNMTVFSFHPVKLVTTGEGGMILTNNKELYGKLIRLRSHGITRDPDLLTGEVHGPWYYEQVDLGFNYRMTDIQAALGISQLKKLDTFVKRRREIAGTYNEAFKGNPYFFMPAEKEYANSSYHLYVIRLKDEYEHRKKHVFSELRKKGIGVQVHYIPVYHQPYYQELGYEKDLCPEANDYYQRAISLPIYPSMKCEEITIVIDTVHSIFNSLK